MVLHAPRTVEGWQVWDLAMRCGGQVRAMPGAVTMAGALPNRVLGYDMTAVLAMAGALGVPVAAVATFMPVIERAAVAAINSGGADSDGT